MTRRVLYILTQYPQLSETYIKNEIEAVAERYPFEIYAHRMANLSYKYHPTFSVGGDKPEQVLDLLRQTFQPNVVHFHYLTTARMYFDFCRYYHLPFTIRAHSFDTLVNSDHGRGDNVEALKKYTDMINSDLCLGVLVFPFSCASLAEAGANEQKLIPSFPVVDVKRFFDKSPNGDAVINVGAALTKKKMEDFMELAKLRPALEFNLYPIGYGIDDLREENARIGGACHVHDAVEPEEMPAIYKHHRWLVYTGDFHLKTVGWPLAVAEAQAAGVGVCMANLRPDLAEYVGDGGGILFDDVRDVADIIAADVPPEMRERGFELCWRSDIRTNLHELTDLWDAA